MVEDLSVYLDAIEGELRQILSISGGRPAPLYQMMQYHMGWLNRDCAPERAPTGKRLRPLMCLLSCETVGGDWRRAIPAAAAIELVHNFSLIHDDIEDKSLERRHRATVWHVWGVPQGVNTGDAVWSLSRLAIYRLMPLGYTPKVVLDVARRIDETCLALCTGQYLDIHFESVDRVSLDEYERMIGGKTGALLSAALAVGAVLGGADDKSVETFASAGRELGLAFQMTDDILGIWGDPRITGKSAASDITERKKTLPILYALDWEERRGEGALAELYAQERMTQPDVAEIVRLVERTGAHEYTRERAQQHQDRTLAWLDEAYAGQPAQDTLRDLILSLVGRSA